MKVSIHIKKDKIQWNLILFYALLFHTISFKYHQERFSYKNEMAR